MPRKRKLPELSEDVTPNVPLEREPVKKQKRPPLPEPQVPLSNPKPRPRPSSYKPNSKPSAAPSSNPNSLNFLKTRIRNLKRLLEHTDHDRGYKMPAGVRIVRERELATCEHDLAEKTNAARESKHRQKLIGRYHQVRFFERQKATRVLKKIRREVEAASNPAEKEEALRRVHIAEVDLNYTMYYPLMRPYSALFPKNQGDGPTTRSYPTPDVEEDSAGGQDAGVSADPNAPPTTKGDPAMWTAVERAMEDGTLDALRNSKPLERGLQATKQRQTSKKESDLKRKHGQKEKGRDPRGTYAKPGTGRTTNDVITENEDSDGGFFE
ncbi:uncharacterized protein BDZ99DRAFT_431789 [Mytilinidion resinicola]|uniref:rRNA-processing protein EFG1 n=1 Tax=Mytilinidion resinicola TaxID=574789 RepID=A0A6A6ZBK1_9PEZI|nr:uncharacterized protein BDZ99DRAFT_431789 [Mytilinidion resinicola]KAF2817597.1 hypothetical protein BDZ99DRAFT_431789 [Mytilinidion resinicola]